MGREIEFRAWNKYHKKMHSVYEINFDHSIAKTRDNETDSTYTFGFIDLELMQFTGIRDKNGVKIFEGDILRERTPVRTYQDHYGENIPFPTGNYREPLEPEIETKIIVAQFESFSDEENPLLWATFSYSKDYLIELLDINRSCASYWNEEIEYLLRQYNFKTEEEFIKSLGIEVIGNIHQHPHLLEK